MSIDFVDYFKNEMTSENYRLPDFRFEEIKNTVADIVARYSIASIPVDVFDLSKKLGIRVVPFSGISESSWNKIRSFGISDDIDGFFIMAEKDGREVPFIFYDDSKSSGRIRFTMLHEAGHFILGHKEQSTLAEAEANFFAKYMIAPPVIAHQIQPNDYLDLKFRFDLSDECAWNAFSYYIKWLGYKERNGNMLEGYEKTLLSFMWKKAM